MVQPNDTGTGATRLAFEVHEYSGLGIALLLLVWWALLLFRLGGRIGQLAPWTTAAGRKAMVREGALVASCLRRFTLPTPDETGAIAGGLQGIGLTAFFLQAASGLGWWLAEPNNPNLQDAFLALHHVIAIFVWVFLCVHVAAALVHEMLGHGTFRTILPRGRGEPPRSVDPPI